MKNIHLLPTDKPSRLVGSILNLSLKDIPISGFDAFKTYNIYITSDEVIKKGNWYIADNKLYRASIDHMPELYTYPCKKIILTTDQDLINDGIQAIDDEFLEWFVKNPSCEEVKISLEETQYSSGIYKYIIYKKEITKKEPKKDLEKEMFELEQELDIPSHLRWYNSKTKQETLEEAAEKYSENWEEITGLDYENVIPSEVNKLDFINGAKWQQEQNKNLYSEEDLLKFGAFVRIEDKKEKRLFLIQDYYKKWFEQFKK